MMTETTTETVAVDAHVAVVMREMTETAHAAAPMSAGPDVPTVQETLVEGCQGEKEAGLERMKIKDRRGFRATEEGLDPAPGLRVHLHHHETVPTRPQRLIGPSRKCVDRPPAPGLDPCQDQDLIHGLGPALGQDASQEGTRKQRKPTQNPSRGSVRGMGLGYDLLKDWSFGNNKKRKERFLRLRFFCLFFLE